MIALSSSLTFGQDQYLADSFQSKLNRNRPDDSTYAAWLKIVAFNESDPVVAEQYADRLIAFASQDSIYPFMLSGYLQKGNSDRLQGNYQDALESFFKSLNIAILINDLEAVGAIYTSIADVYSISGNSTNARLYYNRSISTLRQTSDSISLATALLNSGDEYFNNAKYDTALIYFQESGEIFREIEYLVGTAYNLGNIGMVYASRGQHELAEKNINEGMDILENLQDYSPISEYLTYMSDIYFEKGDQVKALSYAQRSLSLAKQYGLKQQLMDTNLKLSEIHEHAGDFKKSFTFYKTHIAFRDSINDMETVEQLANLRTENEVYQKQIEVDLLNEQKRTQKIIVLAVVVALILIGLLAMGLYGRNKFIQRTKKIIEKEKDRSENLLLNILPERTAQELKEHGKVKAQRYDSVSVLFTDFEGFTSMSDKLSPEDLVESVDFYYSKFDEIIEKYDLEKIKTVGDSYMCAGGLPFEMEDHAVKMVLAALEIASFVKEAKNSDDGNSVRYDIRIGINTGPVVAGVVGTKKFAYDIWGDTVNIASRMESHSEPGKVNISASTYRLVMDSFNCERRGQIEVKNKGKMEMYFVDAQEIA